MTEFTYKHRKDNGNTEALKRWGIDSEYGVLTDLLVGPIDHYTWQMGNAASRRSVRLGREFDATVAKRQHQEMLDAYKQAGVNTHLLPADGNLPYQLYARDSSVMTPWGPIVTQMYSPWRRGEWVDVVKTYQKLDIPIYDIITAGSLEGGDFMVLEPGVILCGYSGERTSPQGFNQMKSWIEKEGWEVKGYQFDPYFLHLDVLVAALAEKLVAVCVDAVEPELVQWFKDRNFEIIDISYPQVMELGVNVVALGNDRVMLPADNTELKEKCRAHGLQVIDPDISMITAGGGGVHCMCQPLARKPA
ncbi:MULTISPECIES: dimethylarginine dimethylaminohydrolase family protein [Microbulbifer]|uniref:arginine deiminase n=1 Tax=Microbulbifer agarilyticus TaxID=260552 RepID=A0A1Q2M126_9GAMM|nr:arginine deiminase family protein [Microbulbifer agarilyticus]AQQ66238.1 amidinotransferase [Microbulbifer agarilyticus]MCA0900183.1 amidinotransferase [Microbulbifer agarilyticus]